MVLSVTIIMDTSSLPVTNVPKVKVCAYPLSTPIEFTKGGVADTIDFNANDTSNTVINFVTDQPGDLLVRAKGMDNKLGRLPIGSEGQVLQVSAGMPMWSDPEKATPVVDKSITVLTTLQASAPIPAGVWTKLSMETEAPTDAQGWISHICCRNVIATPIIDGKFIAPDKGMYNISASVSFTGDASGTGCIPNRVCVRQARLMVHHTHHHTSNVDRVLSMQERQPSSYSGNPTQLTFPHICVKLHKDDEVYVEVCHDASTTLKLDTTPGSTLINIAVKLD